MTTLAPEKKRTVPLSALSFGAGPVTMCDTGLQFSPESDPDATETIDSPTGGDESGTPAADAPPPPKAITIRARTNGVAYQGYWGPCIHDMAGFIPPKGPVPLDWNHSEDQDIGVADECIIDADGLLCKGRLIPFTPSDRAAELIYKGSQGVPYQASMVLDLDNLVVTEVPDGVTYNVNGQDIVGPMTVFSSWSVDGISILPYASDSDTSVEFSRGKGDVEIPVRIISMKEPEMDNTAPGTPADATKNALPPAAGQFSRDEALRFKTDFGASGFDWYLEGKSYPEAAKLFGAQLQSQIEGLRGELAKKDEALAAIAKERDEWKSKAEFRRGHPTPAKVDPPADGKVEETKPDPAHFGRSKGMQAFIGEIGKKLAASNN